MGTLQILAKAPSLSGLEPQILTRMASLATTRTLSRGEFLWQAGDPARTMTILRAGLVKVVRPTPKGRSAICGIFGPPESVGDLALLKDVPYPAGAVVATETATIVQIPRPMVMEAMRQSPALAASIASGMWNKLVALHNKIDVLSAGSVEARLATLLLKLYDQFGDEYYSETSKIPVTLSRRDLAELVSTSFETAIRVMSRWATEGVLETNTDGFTIHRLDTLREIAGIFDAGEPSAE
ncbi:MAG: Crp/Fnr family transcriptional regulator [Myxococcales bacterium]|nr:Crp/Fnr family transcriptional regulator [Myxococcales bacterium]MCB9576635.1 Crp/Fnr family transcriptional regulator [Polyangiaceae bacterium]